MKVKILLLSFVFLFSFVAFADPWKDLHQGDVTAQEFLKNLDKKKSEAGPHPFCDGKKPKESHLSKEDLKGKAQSSAQKDSASQMVLMSSETRPQFKIDPQKDPLLLGSQKMMENPLQEIGGTGTQLREVSNAGKDEILNCEETGDESLETCVEELQVKVIKTKVKKEWQGKFQLSKCSNSERRGHPLPCRPLRQAVSLAKKVLKGKRSHPDPATALNIITPYKACMKELAAIKSLYCSECNAYLPPLGFKAEQIKKVSLLRHPQNPKALHMNYNHWHVYNSGRVEYSYQPFIKIAYEEESHQVLPDEWVNNCKHLEDKIDQGLCSYESKVCTQGKQTRLIEGIPITRDCWQHTFTYACDYPSKNDCGPLRARGCVQIGSVCKQKIGNSCVVYAQTYQCKGKSQTIHQITGGKTPFCLDGNCRDQSYELNDEMMSSIAQLSLLKAMKGKMKSIFTGTEHQCSKHILNFKDCCGSGKGWGKSIGLGSCKSKEKELHEKRKEGLCHYVGTYCAKKVLGKCVKKKSSYCCFGTKLLKAFHEQGRPQIGLGWGPAKEPLCRGFTVGEIQRIDFSKLDLSEVFEDLMKSYQPGKLKNMKPTAGGKIEKTDLNEVGEGLINKSKSTQIQNVGKRVGERVEVLKKGMGAHGK